MQKYVFSLLVKPKLKNILSVLRYILPRFSGKGQNQRVATFRRHKLIEIDRLNYETWSIQKQEQDLIIWQKSNLQMHGFLHEMRKCCIFLCAENQCWGYRDLKKSLSSIWSSVLAYVWYRMLFFFFFFLFCFLVFFPLGFTFNTLHDLLKVIVYKHRVCPSVRSSVVGP